MSISKVHKVLYDGRKAKACLDIVIVGCGLGGLAAAFCLGQAGHRITVLESAPAIGEVGAGIQTTPNLTRLLIRWGLGPVLKEITVKPEALAFHRWKTGERVAYTRWGDRMEKDHGSPYYHIHRADLHKLLFDLATPFMNLRLSSRVVAVDPTIPTVTLMSGEVIKTDLIIGADGIKSLVREVVVGGPDKPVPTGDAAYRAIISTKPMIKDPLLKPLVDTPEMCGWMGPDKHIMAYCIRGKKEYNMVMIHPDDGSVESWTAEGSADKMRSHFIGWEPRVVKLLSHVKTALQWKLMDRAPLDTWVHSEGKVVLLGDACHPMLPYRAQGSAMAIEDGAVIGNLLSRLTDRSQVPALLQAYQALRHPRASATQASARLNQKIFHYHDGPEQEARDASMKQAMRAELGEIDIDATEGNANHYDADLEVEKWWKEQGEKIFGVENEPTSKM
ncbi:FAD/NAD P-binding domain-containing protein [Gloeophyllum trabeum ATCC 11539]|uniref:FAD/NAD P-binding domain-containing protein n=1 Tax=Gloeophyllum trabeum (strain ATCC 11539 / FP-39264 / Madison 617) TaxID=670483 RepID=S7RV39_GLOTA|nr:FAD/NAD P-binding domain-containing protein [Gloeophyllum trabeum ATCC 11539]EPQ57084.1 FAD/NAD P-binding domain-containing protein [Gloeophyllum trabeum ATCC 11539]